MAEQRKIRERIDATEKTYQITNAMNMVSTSKLRRSQKTLLSFRPISDEILGLTRDLVSANPDLHHKALEDSSAKPCYILIASDRGLIGSYNVSLFKYFLDYVNKHHQSKDEFKVATIGYKAFSFAKKQGYEMINEDSANIRDDILFIDFEDVSSSVLEGYMEGTIGKTIIFYNSFVNTLSSKINEYQLLPIKFMEAEEKKTEFLFEPNKKEILNTMVNLYVNYTLYRIILEAKTSEHASRMTAMKNASDNAQEIEKRLTLLYNRARQNSITTELIDIINGSNAVN
ncbi:MAG: ATP synthase F1 subunit gamma [Bacillales bacterium]|nr:ATP synthase F1 subunit gamma [Bacillales bacterium]